MTQISEIDVDELDARIAAGATLIDVREVDEYTESHVPGAVLVPLSELNGRVDEIPTDRPSLIICRSGARSMKACEFLAQTGRDVTNIFGGTLAWIDSGRDVVTGMERG